MKKAGRRFERILEAPMLIWASIFVLAALFYLVYLSLPLSNYVALMNRSYYGVLIRTLKISLSTVLISLAFGFPYAYFMAGLKKRARSIMMMLVIVPFCINALIRIYGWRIILLNFLPKFLYSDGAVLLGMVYGLFPFLVLPIYNAIRKIDRSSVEAAKNLGADNRQVFFDIILPLCKPGIITACIMVFIPSMGLFFLNDLLGGSKSVIAGSLIQNLIHSQNTGMAAAVSVIMLIVTLLFISAYNKAERQSGLMQNSAKMLEGFSGWGGKLYLGLITLFMYLPVFVVMLYSFNASHSRVPLRFTGFSFEWYVKLFSGNSKYLSSLWLSVLVALLASLIALIVGTLAAIASSRRFSRTKPNGFDRAFENISSIPIMIPEIIMGLALMLMLNAAGINNNLLRLVLAHLSFCVPYVYMNVRTGLDNTDPSLLDAAMNLGVDRGKAIIDILLPSIRGSMISGTAIAFAMSLDDFIISFFVYGSGQGTLPMLVYTSVKTGVSPQLNVLCTLIIVLVFVIMCIYIISKGR